MPTLCTIGFRAKPLANFVTLLRQTGVEAVIDKDYVASILATDLVDSGRVDKEYAAGVLLLPGGSACLTGLTVQRAGGKTLLPQKGVEQRGFAHPHPAECRDMHVTVLQLLEHFADFLVIAGKLGAHLLRNTGITQQIPQAFFGKRQMGLATVRAALGVPTLLPR